MVMGGMCVVAGEGACVVVGGMHGCEGHAWLWGGCVWLLGRGHVWLWGACMVGGDVWLLGGMHGCWGACMVAGGHV